jgi:hypothetical protein
MTLQDLDKALGLWNNQLATAAQNLMDLQSHPTYERLADPNNRLQGKTAAQAAIAVNTLSMLLRYYELLQGAISRAEELRRDLPVLFGSEQRLGEIRQILEGRSIQLPPVQVPLGQRGLLSGIENVNCISPAALLSTMAKAFEEAKAIVLTIDATWESLGRNIEAAANRVAALRSDLTLLDEADCVQLRETEAKLQQLSHAAASDPLGTEDQLASGITSKLYELHNKAARNRQLREQAAADLQTTEVLLTTVQSTHRDACGAYAETCEKIASASPPHPKPDAEIEALASWLERLKAKYREGAVAAVSIGLRNWTSAAQEALRSDRASAEGSKRLLETRSELRGRLDALKAKARAYSLAEEQGLMVLAEQAQCLLHNRPSTLDQAASLISEYEAKLNFLARKSVRS